MDKWGQSFATDGAGSTGISWAIPGAVFPAYEGSRRVAPGISPGSYPKFCGLEIIYSPHFPADWQGNAITCDFRAHRIVRFALKDLAVTGGQPVTDDAKTLVARTTAAQGLPVVVTDAGALAEVAAIIRVAVESRKAS